MAFKYLCFAAMIAVTRAAFVNIPVQRIASPVAIAAAGPSVAVARTVDSYDPNPQYSYAYDVQDALTGDSKTQHESRDGDIVRGSYSLVEADGTRRVVNYVADPINGFNAVVHKEPAVVRAAVAAAPVAVAHAPLTVARPIAVARPVALGHGAFGYTSGYGVGYSGHGIAQAPLGVAYH